MSTSFTLTKELSVSPEVVPERLSGGEYERSIDVPAALQAFVAGPLRVVQRREWNGMVATITISIAGQPVTVRGELRLAEQDQRTRATFTGEVEANVPFVGGIVESAVRDEVTAQFERELATVTG